jgi:hypothetical protein
LENIGLKPEESGSEASESENDEKEGEDVEEGENKGKKDSKTKKEIEHAPLTKTVEEIKKS